MTARDIQKINSVVDFTKSISADAWPEAGMDTDEELAWLYGRENDWRAGDALEWHTAHPGGVWAKPGSSVVNLRANPGALTPDEAVDMARALLAAAEQARE